MALLSRFASAGLVLVACGCGAGDDTASGAGGAGGAAGVAGAAGASGMSGAAGGYPLDDELRLNHLQCEGTHNSYHVAPPGTGVTAWQYTHVALDEQLAEQGVRAVELDTYWNDAEQRFEVFHVAVADEVTTCRLFSECLEAIEGWSSAHALHHPLLIQIEPKSAFPAAGGEAQIVAMEEEILAVFPRERIVTPDDVQSDEPTLRAAVTGSGWPTLGAVRGKLLFFVNDAGAFRDAYTHGGSDLDGRLMFVEASGDEDWAAVLILNDPNDPIASAEIAEQAAQGFLVRTRADTDGVEPRASDTSRLEAALASGAHVVSTDFPAKVAGIDYEVAMPGGTPSRCNPVTAPDACTPEAIEDPELIEK